MSIPRVTEYELVAVTELEPGDLVDLEGDPFADPGHGVDPEHDCPWQFEGAVVGDYYLETPGELETPDCFRLDYQGGACGFPTQHRLPRMARRLPEWVGPPEGGDP